MICSGFLTPRARLADIPRRLQTYYKTRGYFAVKVDAVGDPTLAINGHVPVRVTVDPGQVYYFDGVTVKGTRKLRPSYLVNRLKKFRGQPYSPETLDKRFRELTRTGLFNIIRINPTPVDGNRLRLDVNVEEAKPQEFGFSIGYGSYEGAIVGASYANRDPFGYGRPITTSVEYTQRSYKGEILYEDPYLFNTDFALQLRLAALTFDYVGYSKFEVGGRVTLSRQVTDKYSIGFVYSARHVEITDASIKQPLLGPTSYFVSAIGFTQTLDLRKNPLVAPRGFVFDNTLDFASSAIGSEIDLVPHHWSGELLSLVCAGRTAIGRRGFAEIVVPEMVRTQPARLWGARRHRLSARHRRSQFRLCAPDR